MAGIYTAGFRDNDAEKLLLDAMKIRMKGLGPLSPDTLTIMALLSSLYYRLDRYEEALELNMQVSTLRATVLGSKYPDTTKTMSNLAAVYYGRDQFEEGIKLGLKALELSNEVLGPDDPCTIVTLLNLVVHSKINDVAKRLLDFSVRHTKQLNAAPRVLGPRTRKPRD